MSGGAPARVRSSVADQDFLVDLFVNLFEGTEAEDSVVSFAAQDPTDTSDGSDFRTDVERWLKRVL